MEFKPPVVFFSIVFYLFFRVSPCFCCVPKIFTCGTFTVLIQTPFFTNSSSPDCVGNHTISCNGSDPIVQFDGGGFWYDLIEISYSTSSIVIEDRDLGAPFESPGCSFLYDFLSPTPPFNITQDVEMLKSEQTFFDCQTIKQGFDQEFLLVHKHDYPCSTYNFYFVDEITPVSKLAALPTGCAATTPPLSRWNMSFDDTGQLMLLSAGYSTQLELRKECFNCDTIGEGCSSNGVPGNPQCPIGTSKSKFSILLWACVGVALISSAMVCLVFLLIWYYKRRNRASSSSSHKPLVGSEGFSCAFSSSCAAKLAELGAMDYRTPIFSYSELHEATGGFSETNELGDGGFGSVYRGKLKDGRTVAVKRLYRNSYKRVEQFMNEVAILSGLRHSNLVSLYGCTSPHSADLLLVYEFVPNGTLADHLHSTGHGRNDGGAAAPLPWRRRLRIAVETASALAYLHSVEPPIIHRDVKTTNILLDDGFHVKVADFGISRLLPLDATHVSTAPQGTPGYVDPEYYRSYRLNDKSDVYSFGVVLSELISSQPAVDIGRRHHEINLAAMAVSSIQSGHLDQLVDPELCFDNPETRKTITMVAELTFRCLQTDRDMRPGMKEVLEELLAIESGGTTVTPAEAPARDSLRSEKSSPAASRYSPDSVMSDWESIGISPKSSLRCT